MRRLLFVIVMAILLLQGATISVQGAERGRLYAVLASFVDGLQVKVEDLKLSPSVQWSVGVGVGLEYRLTPVIGIYAEPCLQYFFKTGDGLDTWRTAHSTTFSVPLGVRIMLGSKK